MAPDYGLMMLRSGMVAIPQSFYDVPLSHVSLSAPGLYTTIINKVHAGVEYALSFDFDAVQAEALLERLPLPARSRAISSLSHAEPGITFQFDSPLVVTLHARLGKLQQVAKEEFVPLVVDRVE